MKFSKLRIYFAFMQGNNSLTKRNFSNIGISCNRFDFSLLHLLFHEVMVHALSKIAFVNATPVF